MDVVLSIVVGWKYHKWNSACLAGSAIFATFEYVWAPPATTGILIAQIKGCDILVRNIR